MSSLVGKIEHGVHHHCFSDKFSEPTGSPSLHIQTLGKDATDIIYILCRYDTNRIIHAIASTNSRILEMMHAHAVISFISILSYVAALTQCLTTYIRYVGTYILS